MKRTALTVAILVFLSTFVVIIAILPEARAATLYVGGIGPGNYTTIQSAIDNASSGDIIYVYSGMYYENVDVYKTLSLIGESRDGTIIDGDWSGIVIHATADWVNITGFTVTDGFIGVNLNNVENCRVANNKIQNNNVGISVGYSKDNIISNNIVSSNGLGIDHRTSSDTTITSNEMIENGIYISGDLLEHWNTHTIDASNTVNGKPVHYWKDVVGGTVPLGAGQVILANCTDVVVENQNVSSTTIGIELGFSSENTIANNTASLDYRGIVLHHSERNTIINNTVSGNGVGIYLWVSVNNAVINNTVSSNEGGINVNVESDNNTVADNIASNNEDGIQLESPNGITVVNNIVSNNTRGIVLRYSNNNMVANNTAPNNRLGIYVYKSSDNSIASNTVHSSDEHGVFLEDSDRNTIDNNTVSWGSLDGIHLYSSSNQNAITENTVTDNGDDGIHLNLSGGNIVGSNTILNNRYGIRLHDSISNTIGSNNASYNEHGIFLSSSSSNAILNNRIRSNTLAGIRLNSSSNNRIASNNVSENGDGIYIHSSSLNTVSLNTISSNVFAGICLNSSDGHSVTENTLLSNGGPGVSLVSSDVNEVYHNNFIDNSGQAYDDTDTNQWDNGYPSGGNYWSDYTGLDLYNGPDQDIPGSDGIGDDPYVIDSDSQDNYPLTEPTLIPPPSPPYMTSAVLSGSDHQDVTISWVLSSDDGAGLNNVVRYDIHRSAIYDPNGGYSPYDAVPNGVSHYVDAGAGEGDPINYFYYVCAVNLANNSSCSSNQVAKFTRPLTEGPNLVSIPLIQSNESIETVLQTVKYDKAWYYDSLAHEWTWYMTHKDYRRGLWDVNHTTGLWVNVTRECNLTVAGLVAAQTTIHLATGWNLIGFPSFNDSLTVADLKASVPVEQVEAFDGPSPPYFLRVAPDAEVLLAGQSYWVKVSEDTTWVVSIV